LTQTGNGGGKTGKMRSFASFFILSSATAVQVALRSNPCLNNEDVFFPDPEDCSWFYECVDGSVVGHMECPDGLPWNQDLLICDWNAECNIDGCVEAEEGFLPAENNVPGFQGIPSTGPDDCAKKCGGVEECAAWTLNLGSNQCWLKTALMDATYSEDWVWGEPCNEPSSCCSTCTCEHLSECSTDFSSTPPFWGTVHQMPNTITDTDPTEFVTLSDASEGVLHSMWGPNGWDHEVPVWQFTAQFSDSPDVTISFDKDVGDAAFCAPHAFNFAQAVGRTPWYARTSFVGLDFRPGSYGAPEGCNAWGGGGVITICLGVGQELIDNGNIEELFMHEGSHVSVDSLVEGTDDWLCAKQRDNNFISTYARDHPTSEDVAESIVPWYAHTYSNTRVPTETITAIEDAIPARLEVFSSLLGNIRQRQNWAEISKKSNQTRPDGTTRPRLIAPYL